MLGGCESVPGTGGGYPTDDLSAVTICSGGQGLMGLGVKYNLVHNNYLGYAAFTCKDPLPAPGRLTCRVQRFQ
jgi:hypothetical protein